MYFAIYSTLALTVVSAIKLYRASFINHTIITNKDIHITVTFRWASFIPWVPTKMNCYSSNNYKQYSPTSNNCGSKGKGKGKGKGKAVPLQARRGPEGSRKLRFPDFVTTAQDGGRLSALRTDRLYP